MTFVRRCAFLLVLSVTLIACGTSSTTSKDGVTSDRIFVSELSQPVDGLSAYEVVQQYRSHWLRKRGPTSINNPVPIKVYLDGSKTPYGTVESLREISAMDIDYIQRFRASEAQFEFGLGNVAGAILVATKPADS